MITLALIGVGKWGQNYLNTASNLENVEIKYICAQTSQTLNSLPNRYVKTLSIQDLLKNKKIDGFIVATPAITHFAIAQQLLSLGCNLLIEKPLTTNLNDALKLQKTWQIKKPKILIGHLYLYNPAYQTLKQSFKHMKKIKLIRFEGLSSAARKDISVIWDWGPHPVSILLDLIKQPIVEVAACGSISKNSNTKLYDTVDALIRFANGIKASIHISWFGSSKIRRLTVNAENERIEFDDTNTNQRKVVLHRNNTPPQYLRYKPETSLTQELIEFIAAIEGSKKITSDINFGVKVVRVLSAIEQSVSNHGKLVKLD